MCGPSTIVVLTNFTPIANFYASKHTTDIWRYIQISMFLISLVIVCDVVARQDRYIVSAVRFVRKVLLRRHVLKDTITKNVQVHFEIKLPLPVIIYVQYVFSCAITSLDVINFPFAVTVTTSTAAPIVPFNH